MTCRTIRKLLPLFVGGDLSGRKSRRVESHIAGCTDCRRELAIYSESLRSARIWLTQSPPEWEEPAWLRALSEAMTPSASRPSLPWLPWPFRPVWAYLSMAALAAALTLLIVRPLPDAGDPEHLLAASDPTQDIVSMTLVSKETGLKVQWFLNRNFNLKEEIE